MLVVYESSYEKAWDRFIEEESINGTFLQTRNFLNYHPKEKFIDNSLLFMKGNNIIAVIPANVIIDENGKKFVSHMGSTFGGIVLGRQYKKISELEIIFEELENYLIENKFSEIILKQTGRLYAKEESELLEYFLFLMGYSVSYEMGYFINFDKYKEDIVQNFNSSRRRGYKNSLKHELEFKELISDEEVKDFYAVLSNNMHKFHTAPVHTLDEILELKNDRIKQTIQFYGVCFEKKLLAGSAVFNFGKKIFHTQYLASNQDRLSLYINEFLYKSLIETARNNGFKYLSFGTSTLDNGKILNKSLAHFKEGFGTMEYVNSTFYKNYSKKDDI